MAFPVPKNLGDIKRLKDRCNNAFARDTKWQSILQDVYEFLLPQRDLFNEQAEGQRKDSRVFDSTAVNAIKEAASKLQENIAPIWSEWAQFDPGEEVLSQLEALGDSAGVTEGQIRENLQNISKIAFDHINRSNFSTQFYEAGLDLLIGTGTIRVDEGDGDDILVFSATPQNTVSFEEGPTGSIDSHWRKIKCKVKDLEYKWKGFKPSADVRRLIEIDPETMVVVKEGVVYDHKEREYHGVAWVSGEDSLSWHAELKEFSPWVTGRWTKVSGEIRGRGPGIDVLSDVRSLNKAKEFTLQKAAIDIAGMYLVTDDGVTNPYNIRIAPGVAIPVGSNDASNPSIVRMDTNANMQLSIFQIEQMQMDIKRAFFNDLRDPTGAVRSATEVAIEARELAKRIGSAFGRIQTEILKPILERVVFILQRRGIIQPIKLDGKEVKIKFTSPLAKTQDLEELLATQQAFEFTLGTAGEQMAHLAFKTEDFGAYAGKKLGVAQELIRSDSEKAQQANKAMQNLEAKNQNAGENNVMG